MPASTGSTGAARDPAPRTIPAVEPGHGRARAAAIPAVSLSLERVSVNLGGPRCALCDVSLRIEPGEQVALIGPSGAGKTTALSVLAAALRPSEGRVLVDGDDPWRLPVPALRRLRARLFLAPQTPPLPPRQRVVTAVLAGRLPRWSLAQALRSLVVPADAGDAYDALSRFSLQDKLWSRVDRLSGGERQRVSLARALISDAGAFLIDEPLSALDPTLALHTLEVLAQTARERGATLVCSLHQVDLALERFPRVIGLRDGNVVFDRAPSRISGEDISRLYFNRDAGPVPGEAAGPPGDARAAGLPSRCF